MWNRALRVLKTSYHLSVLSHFPRLCLHSNCSTALPHTMAFENTQISQLSVLSSYDAEFYMLRAPFVWIAVCMNSASCTRYRDAPRFTRPCLPICLHGHRTVILSKGRPLHWVEWEDRRSSSRKRYPCYVYTIEVIRVRSYCSGCVASTFNHRTKDKSDIYEVN